nr:hypothetical protein [Cytophagales bacterium]
MNNLSYFLLLASMLFTDFTHRGYPKKTAESPSNEAVIIYDKGVLRLFYINRPGNADRVMSMDWTGQKWSDPREEFILPGQAYYALQLAESQKEDLICVFHVFGTGLNGYKGRHLDLWINRRVNGIWETPFKIYEGYVGAIRGFKKLSSGRLLLTFGKAIPDRQKPSKAGDIDFGWNTIISMYSDDDGQSWQLSKNEIEIQIDNTKTTRYGAIEPDIVELENGIIWMLIRNTSGFLYQSKSIDGGATWSCPLPTSFISSDSPASFLRLKNGKLVLFWNSCQRWDDPNSYAIGGREVLHAAISSDDGLIWKGVREVAFESRGIAGIEKGDRGTAYPSAVEDLDGKILLVTGQGSSRGLYTINSQWLEENRQKRYIFISDTPNRWIQKSNGDTLFYSSTSGKDLVTNFPTSRIGSLEIGPLPAAEWSNLDFALTDHFSSDVDSLAFSNSVFQISWSEIVEDIGLQNKKDFKLMFEWNISKLEGELKILVDGKALQTAVAKRHSILGINYLRINSKFGYSSIRNLIPIVSKSVE